MLDADGHQIIDLGDDFYTVGRPHPMIDPALRTQLIADLGAKPQVRVLLLDVVIGFGATADPAASLVSAWQKACAARSDNHRFTPCPIFRHRHTAAATANHHMPLFEQQLDGFAVENFTRLRRRHHPAQIFTITFHLPAVSRFQCLLFFWLI
eukprot:81661_1